MTRTPEQRTKDLDSALANIEKQFGKGSVMKLGDAAAVRIPAISTGALALDLALGIGGVPRGRVTEIYGPESSGKTTVALHIVAEAQKAGGVAAFIDAEHALDPTYARALGVDINELLVSQPDTGEQALEIADMLIRSSAVDVIVIDSVAALTPRAEIEGEMGDSHVGLQARLMSQALRKIAGSLSKSKTSAIFINQLREKIGVMFGCASGPTRVTLADGSHTSIGDIVQQRLPVEVLTYDEKAAAIVARPVTNWFDNGPTEHFLHLAVRRLGAGTGHYESHLEFTPHHLIMTPQGWLEAQQLAVGDEVIQAIPHRLSQFQWDVVLGGLMGDGALSPTSNARSARLRWGHGVRQAAYGDWKASLFENLTVARSTNAKGAVFHDVQPLVELQELRDAVYVGGKKVLSWDYLKRLTALSLAIWYMDDGTFQLRSKGRQERTEGGSGRSEICVAAFEATSRMRLRDHLADTWGIEAKLIERGRRKVPCLIFSRHETDKLHALLAPYIHPTMDYKLLPRFRGQFSVEPHFEDARFLPVPMEILRIDERPAPRSDSHRYDIEVDGTHNYFADGVMVHNSPETTPGGRALKFYSSVRLDVRRIESLKDGTEAVGNRVRVKVAKNKCVAAGTRVFDPTTGRTHRIEDIVDGVAGSHVWAADKRGEMHVRPIGERMDQGEQDVIALVLRDGTELTVTPDHRVLTEEGWREAGELCEGDRVARVRRAGTFGEKEPIPSHHARMLGNLIGNGDVDGKTPIPADLFAPDVARDVLANLLFGIWESGGWISREQTDGVRIGVSTTSEQLAWQLHWLLLRFAITSHVDAHEPGSPRSESNGPRIHGPRTCYQVRVSGIDNLRRFADTVPMWGPRGQTLSDELTDPGSGDDRGSTSVYLSGEQTAPVLAYLTDLDVAPAMAAELVGDDAGDPQGGRTQVRGGQRLRRDRMERVADALDSAFLRDVLAEELYYEPVRAIEPRGRQRTFDIEVDELHNFVADTIVVHNCAAPFKKAEFDIMYGEGISKEGSLLDIGVEEGVIRKAGAWYTYDGEQLGQGRENSRGFLKEHPDMAAEIEKRVKEKVGFDPVAAADQPADGADLDDEGAATGTPGKK